MTRAFIPISPVTGCSTAFTADADRVAGGSTAESALVPTDARLPGYPAFLAVIFWLFGAGNFRAVMLAQILVDLGTCLVVADLARRIFPTARRKSLFCWRRCVPFWQTMPLPNSPRLWRFSSPRLLSIATAAALNRMREGGVDTHKLWAAAGVAIAACILLRPDGGILLAAVLLYVAVSAPKGAANFGERTASLKRCPDTKPEAQGPLLDTKPETRWPLPDSETGSAAAAA